MPWTKTVTRSPKIVRIVQIGTAIAHIVQTCTHSGTLKRRRARGRHRSAETGNDADGDEERRRADRKTLDPRRQPLQIFVQVEQLRRALVDPIAEHRREHQTDRMSTIEPCSGPKIAPFMIASASVTENGAEATSAKTTIASGIGRAAERANLVLDLRLVADDEVGQRKRGDQQPETGETP